MSGVRFQSECRRIMVSGMRVGLLTCLLVGLVGGCGRTEEPEFDGKPLGEWVEQARGRDAAARLRAYDALGAFPNNGRAVEVLRAVAADETVTPSERLVATKDLFRATGDAGPAVEFARSAIRKESESPTGLSSMKEVDELIFWLGARARPLTPDLQAAHDALRTRGAATAPRRRDLQRIIKDIPAK
jgi:hypothetical protein